MDSLISQFEAEVASITASHDAGPAVDFTAFEERAKVIARIQDDVRRLTIVIGELTNTATRLADTNKIVSAEVTKFATAGGWIQVNKKKPVKTSRPFMSAIGTTCGMSGTDYGSTTLVKVSASMSIPAIVVPSFDLVKQNGELYFVEDAEHFAFRFAGQLFHGNIGNIYVDERCPDKIKDCKFADLCMKKEGCDYYHNPRIFPGSKDRRNFTANSFLYNPASARPRPQACRFGSRDSLDSDILCMQPGDISGFNDRAVHMFLCSLLLNQSSRQ